MTRDGFSNVRFWAFFGAIIYVSFSHGAPAYAACVSPGGQSSHQVFKTDIGLQFCADGNNWSTFLANGAGVPGGSTGHVQFNNAGVFAGDAGLFWDNANKRLGIGTTSPQAWIHIMGSALGTALNDFSLLSRFQLHTGNNSKLDILAIRDAAGTDWFTAGTRLQAVTDGTAQAYIQFNGSGNDFGISFGTGGAFGYHAVTERVRINSSGNVGIGTTSPGYPLHIRRDSGVYELLKLENQQANQGAFIRFNTALTAANGWDIGVNGDSDSFVFRRNATENIRILSSGYVGIGTATPAMPLHVPGGARFNGIVAGASPSGVDYAYPYETVGVAAGIALRLQSPSDIIFHTGMTATEPDDNSKARVIITAAGNVGIGTVAPSAGLEVANTVKAKQIQTEYFTEFSGTISEPSPDHPTCATPYKDVTLGTLTSSLSDYGSMEVVVIGTHRGYNNTSYMEYRNFVIVYGDYVSSALVSNAGSGSKINLLNGGSTGPYSNVAIGGGYTVKLRITASCGSNRTYHYVVRYSGTTFTPSSTRSW